ncbi:MAG: amidohydrolase family protein [Alphaproteobacteria bacterium]|nr:amidohydrolase family protein [Alphaproteobacteria bacterium]
MKRYLWIVTAVAALAACERGGQKPAETTPAPAAKTETETAAPTPAPEKADAAASAAMDARIVRPPSDPYPSSYKPYPSKPTLIVGATILTGTGARIENGAILMQDGKIAAVGAAGDVKAPEGAVRIDAEGKFVTPGIIDIHSHLGVYPSPGVDSTADGNEMTNPNTANVWAEHSVWPQDPGFTRALAGGVTTLQILPGSANLFGGRSAIVKNVPSRTVQGMKFPGAPYGLKMACGENPKRVYGQKGGPMTRMGNMAGYRAAWIEAAAYKKKWDDYYKAAEKFYADKGKSKDGDKKGDEDKKPPEPPTRDLKLETLAGALNGDIRVNMHCYRADEMAQVIDMAKEFGYKVASFHHAVEAYKIADILAKNDICAVVWADWWGFKLEAYDSVRENAALVDAQPNGCAIIHSDSEIFVQRLNQEAAMAMADGNHMGLKIPEERAIEWITRNPAKAMGILDKTGTLEPGKMADVVLWSGDPFSVYTRAEKVFIDGAMLYDRLNEKLSPRTDFELGQAMNGPTGGAGQ